MSSSTTTTSNSNSIRGYLGIDNGTQGISILFVDEQLRVLAKGESLFGFVEHLPEGWYEQQTQDWDRALCDAMQQVHDQILPNQMDVCAIGISGQMHGEVLMGDHNNNHQHSLSPVRLWCDARNEDEGLELTRLFQQKVPKRSTVARFLWTIRNRPDLAHQTRHITTPAGWIHFRLTGQFVLGIGDASGMFPMDPTTLNYNSHFLQLFDELTVQHSNFVAAPLQSLLPKVILAGEDAGVVSQEGADWLGLTRGIPVAAAEGDQPAALAGSLIANAGMVSMSFGTSVVSNSVGDNNDNGANPFTWCVCGMEPPL